MPKSQSCMFGGKRFSITQALERRAKTGRRDGYTCPECHTGVKAHKESPTQAAHFEHRDRNQKCSLSDHRTF